MFEKDDVVIRRDYVSHAIARILKYRVISYDFQEYKLFFIDGGYETVMSIGVLNDQYMLLSKAMKEHPEVFI